jgi:hypothetical protein
VFLDNALINTLELSPHSKASISPQASRFILSRAHKMHKTIIAILALAYAATAAVC